MPITSVIKGKPLAMYIYLQQCRVLGWPNGKMDETCSEQSKLACAYHSVKDTMCTIHFFAINASNWRRVSTVKKSIVSHARLSQKL